MHPNDTQVTTKQSLEQPNDSKKTIKYSMDELIYHDETQSVEIPDECAVSIPSTRVIRRVSIMRSDSDFSFQENASDL